MTLLDEARKALTDLHSLTVSFRHGSTPDPHSVLAYQSDLVRLYGQIGDEMASRFGAKERSYLARKIAHAQEYQKGRIAGEHRLTAADATEAALLAVGDEFNKEIEAAETYERYRVFLKSIQNAIDHSRQVVSFLKTSESSPSA